jgi:glycosyltransferase involved in cell wall biosynthesis
MFRVGVVATDASGTNGGSFTFQDELVRTLFNETNNSDINWVVITPPGGIVNQLGLTSTSIQSVELSLDARAHKFGLCRKWLASLTNSLLKGSHFKNRAQRRSEYFENQLSFLQLDMIWYLGPHPYTQEIPYALTVWDIQHRLQPWFPEVSSNGVWMLRELGTASFIQRATIIVTGNMVGAHQISSTYSIPMDRILVNALPAPSDAIIYKENPKSSEDIRKWREEVGAFILYPAQFWPHKNHKVLLEAISISVSDGDFMPKLVLTGSDKGNLDYMNALIKDLKIDNCVINLGFVSRQDLLYLYTEANALVFPSMFGPDNIPPLEAMAVGCPVLVSDDPGMREQLGSSAIYVSPTSPLDWANAIREVHREPKLRQTLVMAGIEKINACNSGEYIKTVRQRMLEFKQIRETWLR